MRKRLWLQHLDSSTQEEEPLINLTPLIDVVFVVLITFILVAPILDTDSVDLAFSNGVEKKEVQTGPLTIIVKADNSIWIRGSQVTFSQLDAILKEEKKRNPQAVPQLIHDKQAHFGTYQTIKNTLETIGFLQMDVVLKPG